MVSFHLSALFVALLITSALSLPIPIHFQETTILHQDIQPDRLRESVVVLKYVRNLPDVPAEDAYYTLAGGLKQNHNDYGPFLGQRLETLLKYFGSIPGGPDSYETFKWRLDNNVYGGKIHNKVNKWLLLGTVEALKSAFNLIQTYKLQRPLPRHIGPSHNVAAHSSRSQRQRQKPHRSVPSGSSWANHPPPDIPPPTYSKDDFVHSPVAPPHDYNPGPGGHSFLGPPTWPHPQGPPNPPPGNRASGNSYPPMGHLGPHWHPLGFPLMGYSPTQAENDYLEFNHATHPVNYFQPPRLPGSSSMGYPPPPTQAKNDYPEHDHFNYLGNHFQPPYPLSPPSTQYPGPLDHAPQAGPSWDPHPKFDHPWGAPANQHTVEEKSPNPPTTANAHLSDASENFLYSYNPSFANDGSKSWLTRDEARRLLDHYERPGQTIKLDLIRDHIRIGSDRSIIETVANLIEQGGGGNLAEAASIMNEDRYAASQAKIIEQRVAKRGDQWDVKRTGQKAPES